MDVDVLAIKLVIKKVSRGMIRGTRGSSAKLSVTGKLKQMGAKPSLQKSGMPVACSTTAAPGHQGCRIQKPDQFSSSIVDYPVATASAALANGANKVQSEKVAKALEAVRLAWIARQL